MPEILKKSSKSRFAAISVFQSNKEERVSFQAGNRQLCEKFQEKFYGPQVPKNL